MHGRPQVIDQVKKILNEVISDNLPLNSIKKISKIVNEVNGANYQVPDSRNGCLDIFKPIFDYEFHIECRKCNVYTALPSTNRTQQVQCRQCCVILRKTRNNFFIYIPLEQQLRVVLQRHFDSIMRYRDRELYANVISDIICRNIDENNPDSINLTMVMNTDGAKVYDSSTLSLWPLQLYLNFLPPRLRFIPNNMLVVGLYFGHGKPQPKKFFLPLVQEMWKSQSSGFTIDMDKSILFKPFISNCSCDLPARASVQGLKQFNGRSSCGYCLHPGVAMRKEGAKKSQIRYVRRNMNETLRTHQQYCATARRVKKEGEIDGIKEVSSLIAMPCFDVIHGFTIDYMHCILIGVVSTLLNLWLNSTMAQPYHIKKASQKNFESANNSHQANIFNRKKAQIARI